MFSALLLGLNISLALCPKMVALCKLQTTLKSIFFCLLLACSLLRWLFYNPEDGGDKFLRNVGYHSTHYTASHPRRKYSSKPPLWKPQILHTNYIVLPRHAIVNNVEVSFYATHCILFAGGCLLVIDLMMLTVAQTISALCWKVGHLVKWA
jgi:hypothetical protein